MLELEVFEFCADTDSNERLFVRLSYDSHPRGESRTPREYGADCAGDSDFMMAQLPDKAPLEREDMEPSAAHHADRPHPEGGRQCVASAHMTVDLRFGID